MQVQQVLRKQTMNLVRRLNFYIDYIQYVLKGAPG